MPDGVDGMDQPSGSRRHSAVLAVGATIATALAYAPGSDRSLSYDAAETVGFWVLAPNPVDALRTQRSFNNHPLFSFLENLIVRAAGRSDEWILRILPISCAAIAVGVLLWAVHRRLGTLPAIAAGLVLATNPMYIEHGRSVRGYSMLVLAALLSTILYFDLLERETRTARVGYVVAASVGMFTLLFMAPVLLAHAVDLVRRRAVDRRWVWTWAAIGGLTLTFYAAMLDEMIGAGESRGRIFRAGFPLDLARELLGHEPITIVVLGCVLAFGLYVLRRSSATIAFSAAVLAVALVVWLVAPENLAPRFFVWVVPGLAVVAATAVVASTRQGLVFALVTVAAISSVVGVSTDYTTSRNAYPEVATVIDRAAASGANVCVSDLSVPPILAYTRSFEAVVELEDLSGCDVLAVVEPGLDEEYVEAAEELFPRRMWFPARDPAIVFSRTQLPESGR